jgi:tetratricopeptide (TPR) repeat protein
MAPDAPARPASGAGPPQRVSLCMIVKDEEARLPACLRSAADLVDEVVVVDTGSTDRTREVARQFNARVVDFPWRDDFAAARNESLRHATGQWVFWLDADEWLDEDNRRRLRELFARLRDENAAYVMRQQSLARDANGSVTAVDQVRLFRNHPDLRWQYRVHEQILLAIRRAGHDVRWTDVAITHTGYEDAALVQRKLERNVRLLERQRDEGPDDPITLYNLGSGYHGLGRLEESLPLLWHSLQVELAASATNIAPRVYALLSQGHRRLKQLPEAWAVCGEGRARYPDDPELLNEEALLSWARGDLRGAEACLLRLLQAPRDSCPLGADPGLWGYQARHKLAMIYREQGWLADAEAQWRAVVGERPEHTEAWAGLADLWLARGGLAELDQAAGRLGADPRRAVEATLLRAAACLGRDQPDAARHLLEGQLAAHPQSVWLRLGLADVLLVEGDDVPAAEQLLREVLALDPDNERARAGLEYLRQEAGPD